jgi:predicted TIM-barrel fold metal-dependent hydrolase
MGDVSRTTATPVFMQQRSTDEYRPRQYSDTDRRVLRRIAAETTLASERTGSVARMLVESRRGTAIGLRALNDEWGAQFFAVPEEAAVDADAAEHVFSGPEVVIDVQTHFSAPAARRDGNAGLDALYRPLMPDWWHDVDDGLSGGAARDMADYIRKVFLDTETAVAVLTSGPGSPLGEPVDPQAAAMALTNEEMAVARLLLDNLAGTGRLLNHAVVIANKAAEVAAMDRWHEELDPVGWKVYTPGRMTPDGWLDGWMLDDEQFGLPFLERAQALGAPVICAHKGCAMLADNGSPRDIGPAASAFPELSFVVYHSGFELELPEGPYTEELSEVGANRLLRSVEESGLGRGSNVYAELGTTWFSLIRRPREAAHLLGKLVAVLGEDNVIWGTDSIWYGSAQPLVDALRAFQIPEEMCEEFGYSPLTPSTKAKIFGENAARVYGIDLERARAAQQSDDLAWARAVVHELRQQDDDLAWAGAQVAAWQGSRDETER